MSKSKNQLKRSDGASTRICCENSDIGNLPICQADRDPGRSWPLDDKGGAARRLAALSRLDRRGSRCVVCATENRSAHHLFGNQCLFATVARRGAADRPLLFARGLFRAAMNLPVSSSRQLIERYLPVRRIDAVMVTHGHFDHLLDVPEVVALTGARLIASSTSIQLARSAGVPSEKCMVVTAGEKVSLRGATVSVLPAKHDRLFGRVPFDGPPRRLPPRAAGDWVCGEPLAFLIEIGGRRIYIAAGGRPNGALPHRSGESIWRSSEWPSRTRESASPKLWNSCDLDMSFRAIRTTFFCPLSRGFVFGPMTDFPAVIRAVRKASNGSRLILVDYFRPWTLP